MVADSKYNGARFKQACAAKGYQIVSCPRKYNNGEYSHILSDQEKRNIKTYRSRVEHNFSSLKRF